MTPELTRAEWHAIQKMRLIKAQQGGHGHGIVIVEIVDGNHTKVTVEFSELAPKP